MCSLCKRILVYGVRWVELEDAIHELGLFDTAEPPRIEYGGCDGCPPARRAGASDGADA